MKPATILWRDTMNKTPHWLKHSALTIAIASAGISSYPALAQIEGATLRGKVESTTESLAGKKVMARDTKRGYVSETTTREDGSYVFVGLKPGTYQVIVDGETLIGLY